MKDLSKLSSDELVALEQELTSRIGDTPAPGKAETPRIDPSAPMTPEPSNSSLPDLSGMNDDELQRMDQILTNAIGDAPKPKPPAAMPPVINGMFATNEPSPAVQAAADVANIDTNMRSFATPGQNYALPIPGIDPRVAGRAVQGIADMAAPITSAINKQFPQLRQAVDERNSLLARRNAGEDVRPAAIRAHAAIAGALNAADAVLNLAPRDPITTAVLPVHPIMQMLGLTNEHGAIDLAGKFKSIPNIAREAQESPAMFGQSQTIGEFAAPIPGLGNVPGKFAAAGKALPKIRDAAAVKKAIDILETLGKGVEKGKFLPNVANDAVQGGLINSLLTQGGAAKEGKNATAEELATAAAIGTAGGGAIGSVVHGVAPALGQLRKGMNAATKHSYKSTPADAKVQDAARNSAAPSIEELAQMFPDNEEFAALLRASGVHGEVVGPQQPQALKSARNAQANIDWVLPSTRAKQSAEHALNNVDYSTTPQAVQSARAAHSNIDFSLSPKTQTIEQQWTNIIGKIKEAPTEAERLEALRQAEVLRKQRTQGLPKTDTRKQLSQQMQTEISQADQFNRGRKTVAPVENNVLAPKRRQDVANEELARDQQQQPQQASQPAAPPQQAAPSWKDYLVEPTQPVPARNDRPVEPGTGLLRDQPENTAPREKTHREIEAEQFPRAFDHLAQDRNGRIMTAKDLTPSELESNTERLLTELDRPSNKLKNGNPKDNDTTRWLRGQLESLQHEKMRREYRKVKGVEPDHPMDEPLQAPHGLPDPATVEDHIELARLAGQAVDEGHLDLAQQYLDELDRRYPEAPAEPALDHTATEQKPGAPNPISAPEATEAPAFRFKQPEKLGREKYTDRGFDVDAIRSRLPHLRDQADDLSNAARELVQAKTDADYADQLAQDYGEKLFNHFKDHAVKNEDGELVLKAHGHTISQREVFESTRALDRFLQNLHFELGNGETFTKAAKHTEVGLVEDFRKTGMLQDVPLPATKDINSPEAKKAFETLKVLKHAALDAQDHLSKTVKPRSAALLEQAELTHRSAADGQHLALNAGAQLHHVDLNTGAKLPQPVAEVRGQVQHVQESWGKKLDADAKAFYEQIRSTVTPLLGRLQTKTGVRSPNRKKMLGLGGLIGALSAGTEAHASDIVQTAASTPHVFWQQMLQTPVTGPLIAAATVATAGRKIAQKLLDSKNVWANKMFNDTMHAVGYLDRWITERGVAESLERQLWVDNLGTAYRATFGVAFENQAHRIEAVNALRDKTITPQDALAGQGIFADLTPRQREAIVTYQGIQSNMLKQVKARKQMLDDIVKGDPSLLGKGGKIADGRLRNSRDALVYLERALGPSAERTEGEKAFAYLASNFMDYNFFWNPEFHGTNLSDAWIAGGMRVGPINIARAHAMLSPVGGDATLKSLFKASNLVGSNTTERTRLTVEKGKQGFQLPEIEDIPTDKINADRVALGAMLQFAQRADIKPRLEKAGIKSDADFVKQALTSRTIEPELVAEMWGHVAETAARTLGVDPYRMCLDFVSMSSSSPAWGVFVRQPARIATLMTHALAEGNFKGMLRMLGMTALIGGSSAMPAEVRESWKRIDPKGYFEAAKFLDDHSIGAVTGEQLSPKLEWSFMWPLMAAALPLKEGIADIGDDFEKGFDLALKHSAAMAEDPEQAKQELIPELEKWSSVMLRAVGSSFMPRIGGVVPTRALAKGLQAAQQATEGEVKVYTPNVRGAQAPAAKINLDEAGIPRWAPFLDQLVPGTPNYKYEAQQAAAEKRTKKKYAERTGIDLLDTLAPSYSESSRYGGDIANRGR